MLDRILRKVVEVLLIPMASLIGKYLHPNSVTLIAFLFGGGAVFFILVQNYLLGLIFWIINRIFDGLDGAVARISGRQTDFGGYLDILLDFFIYSAVPVAFFWNSGTRFQYLCLALLLSAYYINSASWLYLSSLLEKKNRGTSVTGETTSITMPAGIIGGTETIVFYCLFFIFPQKLPLLFLIFSGLIIVSIFQRGIWAAKNL